MALIKNRTTSLTGESKINGVTVMRMSASLSTEGGGNDYANQSVVDTDLYNANKKEVRKDIADFQEYIYEQQDAIDAEVQAGKQEEATTTGDGGEQTK